MSSYMATRKAKEQAKRSALYLWIAVGGGSLLLVLAVLTYKFINRPVRINDISDWEQMRQGDWVIVSGDFAKPPEGGKAYIRVRLNGEVGATSHYAILSDYNGPSTGQGTVTGRVRDVRYSFGDVSAVMLDRVAVSR